MVIKLLRDVHLGINTLIMHKLRSLLTILGVVFGVASVIAMMAVGEGASKQALDQIRQLGSTNIIIDGIKPAEDVQQATRRTMMSMYGLLYADEQRIRESFAHVIRTVPVKQLRKEARIGSRKLDIRLVGTTPEWSDLVARPLIAGRHLTGRDRSANVAVVTEFVARQLLTGRAPLGSILRIGGEVFEVVGIVATAGGGNVQTPDRDIDVYIPLGVAQACFGDMSVRYSAGSREREWVELHQLIVQVDNDQHVEAVAAGIEALLARFHKRQDYTLNVPLALLRQAQATRRTFNVVLSAIAGISLLVGGIGIMNIMLASVSERTREIGIRRAIGAQRRQIVLQFLIETIVLSATGGLLGITIGLLIPWMITRFTSMPTVVTPVSLVLSLGISVGVGVVFGLYPAVHAARLDPIEALRHE